MNAFLQADWDSSALHPSMVHAPYLMGTGVVTGEGIAQSRPLSPPHRHPDAMLAWCYRGTVSVHLADAMWRLAPGQGVWIPAGTAHTARHEGTAIGCYTYVPDQALAAPIRVVTRVQVPRAVQEMMLHLGVNDMDEGLRVRIQSVLIELLQQSAQSFADAGGEVPLPGDERVGGLVRTVLASPGDPRSAGELCAAHGLHERSVLRIFQGDVGMTFGQWRTGVRLTSAARLMIDGDPVGVAGVKSGYASTSAFSAAFKERYGMTPRRYVAQVRSDPASHQYWR